MYCPRCGLNPIRHAWTHMHDCRLLTYADGLGIKCNCCRAELTERTIEGLYEHFATHDWSKVIVLEALEGLLMKCPGCEIDMSDNRHPYNTPRTRCQHLATHGYVTITGSEQNAESFDISCACGYWSGRLQDIVEHVCTVPHDWPRLLVIKTLETM